VAGDAGRAPPDKRGVDGPVQWRRHCPGIRISLVPRDYTVSSGAVKLSEPEARIVSGKRGFPTALVVGENGAEIYLHSLYDPLREAEAHIPSQVDHETVVFLGTGLGYHVMLTLAANPNVRRVVLVERYPELVVVAAAKINIPSLKVDVVSGGSDLFLPDSITCGLDSGQLQIIPHPPSLQANPAWYAGYHSLVATAGQQRTAPVRGKTLTILVLFGGYYGERECIRGFQALGHNVVTVEYRDGDMATIGGVQKALVTQRPDFIFTVNLRGVDSRGVVGDMAVRTGIPLVVWFVDSPDFILSAETLPPTSVTTFFLWDRSYLTHLQRLGYRSFFLPLAADPILAQAAHPQERFRSRISFVGNSLVSDFLSRLAVKFPRSPATEELMGRAVSAILEHRGGQLAALDQIITESGGLLPDGEALLFFRAYAVHSATTRYRTMLLERLLPHDLTFFGDPPGWQEIFGQGINAKPDVHYFSETPAVYASSQVNFNATSLQMPTTVNQRVFDVPLCGGFLLTDRQEVLSELFHEDEVAVYEGKDDVAEKALYYLGHPEICHKIAEKARQRVVREHTYERRMGELLNLLWG
jgi:spore maturation protein CgeB